MGQWLVDWLNGRQAITETTRETYRWECKQIIDSLGSVRLRDLNPTMVAGFYRQLTSSGLAAKTVKNTHGVLHRALGDAVRAGIVARNVADHQELPRAERPDTVAWTAGELAKFLAHVADHQLYAAWVVMCSTGMRRSEVLGLRWSNMNLEECRVAVVDTVVVVNHLPVSAWRKPRVGGHAERLPSTRGRWRSFGSIGPRRRRSASLLPSLG